MQLAFLVALASNGSVSLKINASMSSSKMSHRRSLCNDWNLIGVGCGTRHGCHLYWLPGSKYLNSTDLWVKVVVAVHVDAVVNEIVIFRFSGKKPVTHVRHRPLAIHRKDDTYM